jgi:hypothetical protein
MCKTWIAERPGGERHDHADAFGSRATSRFASANFPSW